MDTPEIEEGQEQVSLQDDIASAFDEQADIETPVEAAETTETVEPVEETPPTYEPPPMWGKEYRDVFNEWGQLERGPEYQKAMLDLYGSTQAHVTQKEQEAAQFRQQAEQWNGALDQYQPFINQNGMTPQEAARRGVAIMANIQNNPQQFALDMLEKLNYDFASHGQDAPYVPPEVQELRSRIESFEQQQQRQQQEAVQREAHELNQQIQSFASETDASGNLLHPHFQTVEQEMAQIVYGLRGLGKPIPSVGELYEQACKRHPDVAAQAHAEEQQKETARKAAEAKKAKSASSRATGKHTGEATNRSLKEDIESIYDDIAAA